ncbi:MAG TPA: hypothetical protein VE650_18425 [Acetobacteraceae bacterium]|jgi:hypothetical protein|nr:hypothetical protein [Acetobacteraceae bacterium]
MPSKLPQADFEALVRRAGLKLSPAQIAELYAGWDHVEPMLERVRSHARGREAEMALTFRPEHV